MLVKFSTKSGAETHTALVLSDAVGNNQSSDTASDNDIVILGLSGGTENWRQDYSKELNSNG